MRVVKVFVFAVLTCIFGLANAQNKVNIVPEPQEMQLGSGTWALGKKVKINVPKGQEGVQEIAEMLKESLETSAGLRVSIGEGSAKKGSISFQLRPSFAEEEYELVVEDGQAFLRAATAQGFFYAYQTLMQLFPAEVYSASKVSGLKLSLPEVEIKDHPRFGYRGIMLDVARHFMPVSFVKKYIDVLSKFKFNRLHWHLTDDQGWRIEIKKYPKLTEVGSIRKHSMVGHYSENRFDDKPYGGFYTQEEIKEVIAYAKERFVTIIPEIEMPGHNVAALASYPWLGCSGGPYEVRARWGVATDVLCPTEETFTFLENVLTEVMDLFPSEYIHIGGDECPKDSWKASQFCQDLMKKEGLKDEHELQSWFIKRIDKFITSKGRKMIGWDEILEGGISPNATIMSWRGVNGGIEAVKQNHDAIMTPNSHMYLDHYQGDRATEPLAIGGFLPLDRVYSYEPVPEGFTAEEAKHILGVQGNVWTEYILDGSHVEYMTFPRALAIAEIGWSNPKAKNYADFTARLKKEFKVLDELKVNYSSSHLHIDSEMKSEKTGSIRIDLKSSDPSLQIRYSTNGQDVTDQSALYDGKGLLLSKNTVLKAALFDAQGQAVGAKYEKALVVNKATGLHYSLRHPYTAHSGGSEYGLTNGIKGQQSVIGTWVGFPREDFEMSLDLEKETPVKEVKVSFLDEVKSWVLPPSEVEVAVSADGKNYNMVLLDGVENDPEHSRETAGIFDAVASFDNSAVRYIRVRAKNGGLLPKDHNGGAGKPSWLCVDEIEVF
ncbi:family 20 glycosylhydrolase [Marinilongibacter aquaticus]|uniref:beta-N-acetylhexosaminidase n=1 Tax=Marinilongibacter aquaticus TaxID=2975157 RepID=UPI0021BD95C5|nr:family 20 glycosylhydrolase [Marinilongibacter aquaticus]UBM60615.1 family 20 glycosylhydrolase [Marinilongibacter aquaticus]